VASMMDPYGLIIGFLDRCIPFVAIQNLCRRIRQLQKWKKLKKRGLSVVYYMKLTYSVTLVRKGTIPTERPQLVGEVSANFCG
jgi:hypothetical protein